MENETPPIKESEFNSSVATLRRLDEIKKHLDSATVDNDCNKQYHLLKAFIKELVAIISKKDGDKHLLTFENIKKAYLLFLKGELQKETFTDGLDAFELELRITDQLYNLNMKMGRDKRWVV